MQYQDLRKIFHELVYPSRPNEWDIEDALHDLEDLEDEQQRLLLQAIPIIWPISHSLSFSFLKEGARNAGEIDRRILPEWLRRILFHYEEGGLKKAREYMAESDHGLLYAEDDADSVVLAENVGRLTSYARGISGLDLKLQGSTHIYTDTETIYLPEKVNFFPSFDKNLLHYKFMITLQSCFILQGSLSPHRLCTAIRSGREEGPLRTSDEMPFFAKFEHRQCARDLYQLLEIYRAMKTMQSGYPGLIRETVHIRRKLIRLRLANERERSSVLESLFTSIILPEQKKNTAETALLSQLQGWRNPYPVSEILEKIYRRVADGDTVSQLFNFQPFMDRFHLAEAWSVTEKRIERNKKQFETSLAHFIFKNKQIPEQKKEQVSAVEQADSARLQPVEAGRDEPNPAVGAGITIDNKSIELPEELRTLLRGIEMDLGRLPEGYVSAAFGLVGQGRSAGEGQKEGKGAGKSDETSIPYDEWDYRRHGYRKNWCGLRQRTLQGVRSDFVERSLSKHRGILVKIRRQFEMMRTQERFARRRRYGDDLDLDALMESIGDRYAGLPPSDKVFIRLIRNERSISTLFLVDMSNSTEGWVGIAIKEALVLLCEALEAVGDRYGIFGFSGMRRMRSEVYKVKDISERYSYKVRERIAAIGPKEYTRMGPPIRHMITHFADIDSKSRLLLLLSDGKPEDYDDYKGQYAIEDTRKALAEARGRGIHPYCITIDRESHDYLEYLFGRGNFTYVQNIEQLPSRLTEIYRLLTR